jgi:pyruvate dehydrogenase E2 component (dihydrolipoamide acetyltransferase)
VLLLAGLSLLFFLTTRDRPGPKPAFVATTITLDRGLHLRAIRAGEGDTTLVFLHGFGESLLSWRPLLEHFARQYQVLAPDLPGFGLSDPLPDSASFQAYISALAPLLSTEGGTGKPVIVVGHSMGGALAAGLALAYPDRIAALVLIAPAGAGLSGMLGESGLVSPRAHWLADAVPYVLPLHDPEWLREDPHAVEAAARSDSLLAVNARRVLQQFDFAAIGTRFRDLHQPVLLLWGRQDPTIPTTVGDLVAAMLPCRSYVVLPALHRPHQTIPDTVIAEMDRFLRHPISCGGP